MKDKSLLLSSVFKPFGVNDQYGREENKAELLITQVTRVQGIFSPRVWCSNLGLHLIGANVDIPTTIMEWPSIEEFVSELRRGCYAFVGISFIACTLQKAKLMVEITRKESPESKIIIGGTGVSIPNIDSYIDVDYICYGDGIRFTRNLLNKTKKFTFHHPVVPSKSVEYLGIPIPAQSTGMISTGLGCSKGCEFCSTSAFFDCQYQPFMTKGEEIFELLEYQYKNYSILNYWILDENFLEMKERARELHDCICNKNNNAEKYNIDMIWSSADNVSSFDPEYLAEMGIASIWMGFESLHAPYKKNRGVNFKKLIEDLADFGIITLLSYILFYDYHNEENLNGELDFFYRLGQAYSQFLPITAWPGTPLYEKLKNKNRLFDTIPWEEKHGLTTSLHKHPCIPIWKQQNILLDAFNNEYRINGPSTLRIFNIQMKGYKRFLKSNSKYLRKRIPFLRKKIKGQITWVMALEELVDPGHNEMIRETLENIKSTFGKNIIFEHKESAKYLVKLALRGISQRNGNLTSMIQPECRITKYYRGNKIEEQYLRCN